MEYPWVYNPDSKVHGANMGPTWVLSAPVGPTNLALSEVNRVCHNVSDAMTIYPFPIL